ncbi:MAG: thioredoxin-like domain-containing protein [Bacteroidales bacterium]|nr:redoxin domain-containing protein [Bacteroidales bacterium]
MKKVILAALLTLVVFSCSKNYNAKIYGKIEGATSGTVVLKILEVSAQKSIDSLKFNSKGEFSYSVQLEEDSPNFYYLYYNNNKVASMVLLPGDNIKIITDTLGTNPVVSGSQEAEIFSELDKSLQSTKHNFDSLVELMQEAQEQGETEKETSLNYSLGKLYVKQKQAAIKQIYSNPNSIANVMLLYYKLADGLPLFADPMDVHIFNRVHDSLKVLYPNWVYLQRLKEEVNYREKSNLLSSKINEASVTGFPDISLPDIKAVTRSLSDFPSKVILLSFWTITETSQKMINLDYKDLYEKYNSKGLEIYQVSLDSDKTAWATAVSEQELPWTSVCDGLGTESKPITTYNITQLPANFIIDRNGEIVAKDVYDNELEKLIRSLL